MRIICDHRGRDRACRAPPAVRRAPARRRQVRRGRARAPRARRRGPRRDRGRASPPCCWSTPTPDRGHRGGADRPSRPLRIRVRADARHQRDRGAHPHEPGPGDVAAGGDPGRRGGSVRATVPGAGPADRAPGSALPGGRGAPGRAHRVRGRARDQQLRRRAGARGRPRRTEGRRRRPRRAGGDRRRRPDPGDRAAGRGAPDRGRDDQPDAGRRLRGAAARRARDDGPSRASVQLHAVRVHGGAGRGRARGAGPRARRGRRRRSRLGRPSRHGVLRPGPRADARRASSRPAPTSSSSRATSWSVGRRRGSSSAARTWWHGCARIRSPGRCGPTRPPWRPSRRRSASTGRASRRARSRSGG